MPEREIMTTTKKQTGATFDRAVENFARQRQHVLATLIEELGAAAIDPEKADFSRILNHAQKLLRKTDLDMSVLFKVSRPTVNRWTRGITAPHPMLRKAVFDTLLVEAKHAQRSRIDC
jgi:hypothetical protein